MEPQPSTYLGTMMEVTGGQPEDVRGAKMDMVREYEKDEEGGKDDGHEGEKLSMCEIGDNMNEDKISYGVNENFPRATLTCSDEDSESDDEERRDEAGQEVGDEKLPWGAFHQRILRELKAMQEQEKKRAAEEVVQPTRSEVRKKWGLSSDAEMDMLMDMMIQDDVKLENECLKRFAAIARPRTPQDQELRNNEVWTIDDLDVTLGGADPMKPPRSNPPKKIPAQQVPDEAKFGVPLSKLVIGDDEFLEEEEAVLTDSSIDGKYAMRCPGHMSRRCAFKRPWVWPSRKLTELGKAFIWDIKDRNCCVVKDIEDTPLWLQKQKGQYRGNVFNMDYVKERLPDWCDEETLFNMEYGQRFTCELEPGVVVCPANLSVRPYLEEFGDLMVDQVNKGTHRASVLIDTLPSYFYPYGAACPNWKWSHRLSSDLRIHGFDHADASKMSLNDSIMKEDIIPPKWLHVSNIHEVAELQYRLYNHIVRAHPECRETLRLASWMEDGASYFHQLGICKRDRAVQGHLFPFKDRDPWFVTSDVALFGPRPCPFWAQKVSCIPVALVRMRMWELEEKLMERADGGCPIAMRLSPSALRDFIRSQSKMGGRDKLPTSILMYIDDLSGSTLGIFRAMAGLIATWTEMDRLGMKYGITEEGCSKKAQLGHSTELLGIDTHWGWGLVNISRKKRFIVTRWINRVLKRKWITQKEMEKLWGTIANLAIIVTEARLFMSHGYRAKTSKGYVRSSKYGYRIFISDWLKDSLANLLKLIMDLKGKPFSTKMNDPRKDQYDIINITDAARTMEQQVYSGIGGTLLWKDVAVIWSYQLDQTELEKLEIHVTEMWASLTGTALIPWLRKKVAELKGEAIRIGSMKERVDNMGVVLSIKGQRTKDVRNEAMLALRLRLLKQSGIVADTEWISTKDPEQYGDDMSRGNHERVAHLLRGKGFNHIWKLDLREGNQPLEDLGDLRELLLTRTEHHRRLREMGHISRSSRTKSRRNRK